MRSEPSAAPAARAAHTSWRVRSISHRPVRPDASHGHRWSPARNAASLTTRWALGGRSALWVAGCALGGLACGARSEVDVAANTGGGAAGSASASTTGPAAPSPDPCGEQDPCLSEVSSGITVTYLRTETGELLRTESLETPYPSFFPSPPARALAGKTPHCAFGAEQSFWCWDEGGRVEPTHPDGTRVERVLGGSGGFFGGVCFVLPNEQVLCDRLGQPSSSYDIEPEGPYLAEDASGRVLSEVVEVSRGNHHACARVRSGTVYCWGDNSRNQLGSGPKLELSNSTTAVAVHSDANIVIDDFTRIAAGYTHNCGIRRDGSVWCWGSGLYGQNGFGGYNHPFDADHPYAIPVEGTRGLAFVDVSLGGFHSCAVATSGRVYCWGWNSDHQLGDGTTHRNGGSDYDDASGRAVEVLNLTDAVSVSAGNHHTCALTARREVWCWGSNDRGELGDGSAEHEACTWNDCSSVPVKMALPATRAP